MFLIKPHSSGKIHVPGTSALIHLFTILKGKSLNFMFKLFPFANKYLNYKTPACLHYILNIFGPRKKKSSFFLLNTTVLRETLSSYLCFELRKWTVWDPRG